MWTKLVLLLLLDIQCTGDMNLIHIYYISLINSSSLLENCIYQYHNIHVLEPNKW